MNQPNLLLMVNKSKKIDVNEMIKPNIINGFDLMFSSLLGTLFEEVECLSFLLRRRFGKGLITIKSRFKLMPLKF